MASGDIALRLLITGSATQAIGEIAKLATSALGVNGALATAGVIGAAAVVGIGVAAVKAAGDFQQNMNLLVTSAGESKNAIGAVSKGILQMSVDTGTSTDQLAKGMYFVESAGYHGADGLAVMQSAAEGAKTENADLGVVAKALTTLMVDYKMKASDSAKAMNGLIATVQNGKTTLQDLSSSMGAVLPIASSLHISFPQVAGAMDTMTNAGVPAQQAAQNLAHVLVALSAPSGVATKAMTSVGLSAQQVKDALVNQGLPEALQLIEDHVGKKFPEGSVANETALKNIMGGLVGLKLAAQLTGGSLKETEDNIAKVTKAMNDNGNAVMGWDVIQGNLNFQLARAKEALNALLIVIGQALLPVVTQIVKGFADFIATLIKGLSGMGDFTKGLSGLADWFEKNKVTAVLLTAALGALAGAMVKLAVDGVASLIAAIPDLVSGLIDVAAAAWAAVGPFALVGAAIAAVIAIFVLLYKNVAPFREFVDNIVSGLKEMWTWFTNQIKPALDQLGETLKKSFIPVWKDLADAWKNQLLPALKQLWDALQPLMPILQDLATGTLVTLVAILVVVTAAIVALIKVVAGLAEGLAQILGGAIKVVTGLFTELAGVLSAIFDIITGHWDKVGDDLKTVWEGIKTQMSGGLQMIQGLFMGSWDAISGYFSGLGDVLGPPLKAFWQGFASWWSQFWQDDIVKPAGQAFSDLGTLAHNAVTAIGGIFDGLGTHLHNFWQDDISKPAGNAFSDLGTVAHTSLNDVVGFFVTGFQEIGGQFTWLYNHNYYIKNLCDSIKSGFTTAISAVESAWNGFSGWWTKFWTNDISQPASKIFPAISTDAQNAAKTIGSLFDGLGTHLHNFWTNDISTPGGQAFSDLGTFAQGAVKNVGSIFDGLGTHMHDFWQDDISKPAGQAFSDLGTLVKNAMDGIGGLVGQACSALGTQLSDFFNGMAKQAFDWGANLIQNFIQGIGSMFSALGSKVHDLAQTISNLLGFHSPTKEGPGSTADKWAPALVSMFASGLVQGIPKVRSASMQLAGGMASAFAVGNGAFALPSAIGAGPSSQQGTMNVAIQLDGKVLMQAMNVRQGKEVRIAGYRHA